MTTPPEQSALARILADADHHEKCAALSKTSEGATAHSGMAAGLRIAAEHVRRSLPAELEASRRNAIRIQALLDEQRDRTRKACDAMTLKADALAREAVTTSSDALLHLATGYGEAARNIAAAAFRSQPKETPQ